MPLLSPEPLAHLPQHRLLPMLLARVRGPGSLTRVLFGHSVKGVEVAGGGEAGRRGGVVVTAHSAVEGRDVQLEGSFLVAADGAHSTIR